MKQIFDLCHLRCVLHTKGVLGVWAQDRFVKPFLAMRCRASSCPSLHRRCTAQQVVAPTCIEDARHASSCAHKSSICVRTQEDARHTVGDTNLRFVCARKVQSRGLHKSKICVCTHSKKMHGSYLTHVF